MHVLSFLILRFFVCYSAVVVKMAGRGVRRDDNPQAKIIIRNYPLDTTERDLRIMFEKYGKIDDCEL